MDFQEAYIDFFKELGESKVMVLSTSLDDKVTSRTMSIVILDGKFYFQTDRTFRKYRQLKENANVSLCAGDIEIEGQCMESGKPSENPEFSEAFQKNFLSSYNRYTALENERLFVIEPAFIQRWLYIEGEPYIQRFDVAGRKYDLSAYVGE